MTRFLKTKVAVIATLSGLLFGYDLGVISGGLVLLESEFHWSDFHQELFVSSLLAGALVGSPLGGLLSDWRGRRAAISLSSALYAFGSIGLAISSAYWLLVWFRIVLGLGVGVGSTSVPVYLSEMAPQRWRGTFVALNEFSVTAGIVLSFLLSFLLADLPHYTGWRWLFGLAALPATLQLLGTLFILPPSPRWLATKERRKSLRVVGAEEEREEDKSNVQLEVDEEQSSTPMIESSTRPPSPSCALNLPNWLRSGLTVGVGLSIFQQITGQPNVLYYNATIIEQIVGTDHEDDALSLALIPAVLKMVATSISIVLVDRVGRKPLLCAGVLLMFSSLVALSIQSALAPTSVSAVAFLSLFLVGYSIGFGPNTYILMAEVMPLKRRGLFVGLSSAANWLSSMLVSVTFLSLIDISSLSAAFAIYASICLFALAFVLIIVQETKGMSLEEIEQRSNDQKDGSKSDKGYQTK